MPRRLRKLNPLHAAKDEKDAIVTSVDPGHSIRYIRGLAVATPCHLVRQIAAGGRDFLPDLIGSQQQGLKQIFSSAWEHSPLIVEYVRRYGAFDGFFARQNVTAPTHAAGVEEERLELQVQSRIGQPRTGTSRQQGLQLPHGPRGAQPPGAREFRNRTPLLWHCFPNATIRPARRPGH
jgi:hypothetical protein